MSNNSGNAARDQNNAIIEARKLTGALMRVRQSMEMGVGQAHEAISALTSDGEVIDETHNEHTVELRGSLASADSKLNKVIRLEILEKYSVVMALGFFTCVVVYIVGKRTRMWLILYHLASHAFYVLSSAVASWLKDNASIGGGVGIDVNSLVNSLGVEERDHGQEDRAIAEALINEVLFNVSSNLAVAVAAASTASQSLSDSVLNEIDAGMGEGGSEHLLNMGRAAAEEAAESLTQSWQQLQRQLEGEGDGVEVPVGDFSFVTGLFHKEYVPGEGEDGRNDAGFNHAALAGESKGAESDTVRDFSLQRDKWLEPAELGGRAASNEEHLEEVEVVLDGVEVEVGHAPISYESGDSIRSSSSSSSSASDSITDISESDVKEGHSAESPVKDEL